MVFIIFSCTFIVLCSCSINLHWPPAHSSWLPSFIQIVSLCFHVIHNRKQHVVLSPVFSIAFSCSPFLPLWSHYSTRIVSYIYIYRNQAYPLYGASGSLSLSGSCDRAISACSFCCVTLVSPHFSAALSPSLWFLILFKSFLFGNSLCYLDSSHSICHTSTVSTLTYQPRCHNTQI